MNACRDVVPCNDNVPAIIAPGSKGRSACLGLVPFSNNVLGTDMLPRKERSACPGVVPFKGPKSYILTQRHGKVGSLTTSSGIAQNA